MNFEEFKKEVIKYFIFITIRRMDEEKRFTGLPDIKFVFMDDQISFFQKLINEKINSGIYEISNTLNVFEKEYLELDEVNEALDILKKNKNDYINYEKGLLEINDNTFFIKVSNLPEFINLLAKIQYYRSVNLNTEEVFENEFLSAIWLRMNPSDLLDVNAFLKRELSFMTSDCFIDYNSFNPSINNFNNYNVSFESRKNGNCYETNLNLCFYLFKNDKQFFLPMIHYAISEENGKKICYIYGIQDDKKLVRDEEIAKDLQGTKKTLRNKYVKYTFLLALKLFIELLKQMGIEEIKVPLLQVMNYEFHENLSLINEKIFPIKYPKHKQEVMDAYIAKGVMYPSVYEYIHDKELFERFHEKQDIISKNKTERLVETFMILNEKYDLFDILNDPFIEDENLNIKIKK